MWIRSYWIPTTILWEKQHHPKFMAEKTEAQKVILTSPRSHHQEGDDLIFLDLSFLSCCLSPHGLLQSSPGPLPWRSSISFTVTLFSHWDTSYKAELWDMSSNHRCWDLLFSGGDQPALKHWIWSRGWNRQTLPRTDSNVRSMAMKSTSSSMSPQPLAIGYYMVLTKYLFKGWVNPLLTQGKLNFNIKANLSLWKAFCPGINSAPHSFTCLAKPSFHKTQCHENGIIHIFK